MLLIVLTAGGGYTPREKYVQVYCKDAWKKGGASAINSSSLGRLFRVIRKYLSRMFNYETVASRLTKGHFVHTRRAQLTIFFKRI